MSPAVGKRIDALESRLSDRDRQILDLVHRFRLLSGFHIHSVMFESHQARLTRRVLGRLVMLGALETLDRRIGGVRAGSTGLVYRLAPDGRRLVERWHGDSAGRVQRSSEPGARFVGHTLAVADIFVRLHAATRSQPFELIQFATEPACWRAFSSPLGEPRSLKPDAHMTCEAGNWEYRWFVEVDLATEGVSTLRRKFQAYVDYWQSGVEQAEAKVFPRVLWLTVGEQRVGRLRQVIDELPTAARELFQVAELGREVALMIEESA